MHCSLESLLVVDVRVDTKRWHGKVVHVFRVRALDRTPPRFGHVLLHACTRCLTTTVRVADASRHVASCTVAAVPDLATRGGAPPLVCGTDVPAHTVGPRFRTQ